MRTSGLLILTLSQCLMRAATPGVEIDSLFPQPDESGQWVQTDPIRVFTGAELFALIDGGADIYYEYGFTRVATTRYASESGGTVAIELYEMQDPVSAYGIVTFVGRETEPSQALGQELRRGNYYLYLWKGRFLATFTASDTSRAINNGMLSLASIMEGKIPREGSRPPIADVLLGKEFPHASVVYVKGALALTNVSVLGELNAFPVDEGATGQRGPCQDLLLRYRSAEESRKAMDHAIARLRSSIRISGVMMREDGWECLIGSLITARMVPYRNYLLASTGPDAPSVSSGIDILKAAVDSLTR